jgi:hypothetical protein
MWQTIFKQGEARSCESLFPETVSGAYSDIFRNLNNHLRNYELYARRSSLADENAESEGND